MTHNTIPTLFAEHTLWTESPCFYVAAFSRTRMALLAGPYRTRAEAEAALPHAEAWAKNTSGDPEASSYCYSVYKDYHGYYRSILGEI